MEDDDNSHAMVFDSPSQIFGSNDSTYFQPIDIHDPGKVGEGMTNITIPPAGAIYSPIDFDGIFR